MRSGQKLSRSQLLWLHCALLGHCAVSTLPHILVHYNSACLQSAFLQSFWNEFVPENPAHVSIVRSILPAFFVFFFFPRIFLEILPQSLNSQGLIVISKLRRKIALLRLIASLYSLYGKIDGPGKTNRYKRCIVICGIVKSGLHCIALVLSVRPLLL